MTTDFNVYAAGEVVDVKLSGAVVAEAGEGYLTVRTAHDELTVAYPQPALQIVRMRPADGMPQPGEVWRDRFGQIWFARGRPADQARTRSEQVAFYGADSRTQHPSVISQDPLQVHREFGPIERIWAPPAPEQDPGSEAAT